jgi:hypothetical protein
MLPEQVGGYFDASKHTQRSTCIDKSSYRYFWLMGRARVVKQSSQYLGDTHITIPGFVDTKMSAYDIHESLPVAGYGMSVLMAPLKKD